MQIDKGESSAIALALETPDSTVILDDYRARKIAEQLGVSITGTIGVIIKAKLNGAIPSIIETLLFLYGRQSAVYKNYYKRGGFAGQS